MPEKIRCDIFFSEGDFAMIGKGTETVFGYTLRNAWGSLLSRIRVMDGPDGGYAEYVVYYN
jgi:hypothetical protein